MARMTVETIRVCLRYRVTGLASEAGFFMLLSLPPLVLGLSGGVGFLTPWLGKNTVDEILNGILMWAAHFLTTSVVDGTVKGTMDDLFHGGGRPDLVSVGFLLSVWSGSRALNVFVDTISIMYGQSGVRGIVRTRALSLTLYLLSLVVGIVVIPLVVIGPDRLAKLLHTDAGFVTWLYWPVVTVLAVASIATLFHISTPRRTPWLRDLPGAVLTLVLWSLASFVLRGTIAASLGGVSIYGPLATPIVLLIWLYTLAIAVLIGAALNAAIRVQWPVEERLSLRAQAVDWVKAWFADRQGGAVQPVLGSGSGARDEARDAGLGAADELLASVGELKEEAARPLTPVPEGDPEGQFGERDGDRILSVRTRSG